MRCINSILYVMTNRCNLQCTYCYAFSGPENPQSDMSSVFIDKAFQYIINHLREGAIKDVVFSGGEPTLNITGIRHAVSTIRERDLNPTLVINTNGVISSESLKYLISEGFKFRVSCDGPPAIQNAQRPLYGGKPSSRLATRTIVTLVQEEAPFVTRCTLTSYSAKLIDEIIEYFANLGIKYISLDLALPLGKGELLDRRLSVQEFAMVFKRALDIGENYGLVIVHNVLRKMMYPSPYHCPELAGRKLVFLPDGHVSLCVKMRNEHHPLARYFFVGSYDKERKEYIIDLGKIDALREHVHSAIHCKGCDVRRFCSGGCPIISHALRKLSSEGTYDALPIEPPMEWCSCIKNMVEAYKEHYDLEGIQW